MTTPDDPYAGQPAPEHGQTPQQPPATPPPPQQPQYYGQPPVQYYAPPAPKPPSRVAWFFIGAGSMFALGVVGIFGFFAIVGALLGEDFGGYEDDGYYYVDQTSVVNAVEGPCANMRSAASDIDMFSDPKAASADIQAVTLAINGIVEAIDANNPDSDSSLWRDDWKLLSADLDTYADELAATGVSPKFRPFTEVKQPLIERMSYSSEADCEVPAVIEALDRKLTLDGEFGY